MKIRMLKTLRLAGTYPVWTFYKGRTYPGVRAVNQPRHAARGLWFVWKLNGQSMLVSTAAGECEVVK